MKLTLVFAVYFLAFVSRANTPCDGIHKPALGKERLTQLAGPIGKIPNRFLYQKYADDHHMKLEEVYQLFSFNGRLVCNGTATANITLENNVLTTVAHAVYTFAPNCKKAGNDWKDCHFYRILGPNQFSEPYDIESVEAGDSCPKDEGVDKNDWAVIRLKKPVEGANRLIVSDDCVAKPDVVGMSFSAQSRDTLQSDRLPEMFGRCSILHEHYRGIVVQGDCSLGYGSSGGAFACELGSQLALGGLNLGSNKDPEWFNQPYDPGFNYTTFVPINDKIKAAIKRAAGHL